MRSCVHMPTDLRSPARRRYQAGIIADVMKGYESTVFAYGQVNQCPHMSGG